MGSIQDESQPVTAPGSPLRSSDRSQIGILLCRDLFFITKVRGTARSLGYDIKVICDVSEAKAEIASLHPRVVFIDLTGGDISAPAALTEYVAVAGSETWLVAFGPHVDVQSLTEAKAAGCQVVLPRSKFAGDLPRLLQFYFSQHPGDV